MLSGRVAGFNVDVGDGLTLHVTRSGTGPPILFLHGFTGLAATWTDLVGRLENRYSCIGIDLPGHGLSSSPENSVRFALSQTANDLAHVLEVLGIDKAAIIGYSLGGRTALRFALEHPERVAALVLEGTSGGIADSRQREVRRESDDALARMIETEGVEAFVNYWENLPIWESQKSLAEDVRNTMRRHRLGGSRRGLANSLRGAGVAATGSVDSRLVSLTMPALIVAGALDEKFAAAGRVMEASMGSARLELVDGAGHAVHVERPAVFGDLVEHFFDEVRTSHGGWR